MRTCADDRSIDRQGGSAALETQRRSLRLLLHRVSHCYCFCSLARLFSSLPGEQHAQAPPEVAWKLAAEEELRLEIEGRGHEHKCTVQVRTRGNKSNAEDRLLAQLERKRTIGAFVSHRSFFCFLLSRLLLLV